MSKQGHNNIKNKGTISKKFTIKMQKKLVVLFAFVLLAFAGLTARLLWISREDGERYKKQAFSQRRYDSTTLPYRRGDIVDAKGTKIAVSEKVYNLVVDSKIILKTDYLETTLQALGANFPSLDLEEIRNYVTTHPNSSWYVPLKRLTYEEISGFQALAVEDKKLGKCIWFEKEYKRIYPYGSLACDVIGFSNADNIGQYGLEEYYNNTLNGTTGREYGYLNDDADLERSIKPAVDGHTIHSTIDVTIQGIVEKYIKQFNDEHLNEVRPGNGAEDIGCIIMEANTGNILAMASYPTFDLNNPKDISSYYSAEEIAVMEENDTYYDTLNQLWRNYCISDTYEPGSTSKPFTVAAALEMGAITGNEEYYCEGKLEVGGWDIRCHTRWGDKEVTVQDSIAWSCNVALMKIAQAMGPEHFSKSQEIFNFGLKTNIDLAGETKTDTMVRSAENMKAADLATNSFGQNFNVTMIQMISGFCSLINGGYYYEPHMVSKITNASGATVENIEPRVLKQTISESTSEKIRQYCRATVMEEGGDRRTGKTARPAGYAIGGKTGTAQTHPRDNKEYVVSFIGYAPAEDPQIAIYVVVNRANVEKQDQARFATEIVRNILTEVLPHMGIYKTEELSEAENQELNERDAAVKNMYAPKPEDENHADGVGEEPAEGSDDGVDGNDDNVDGNEVENSNQPVWKSFEKDPETGYYIDPETGSFVDPDTGDLINDDFPALLE